MPSEALSRANTFDLIVLNTSTLWENHRYKQQEAAINGKGHQSTGRQMTQEEMMAMMRKVKGDDYGRNKSTNKV